MRIRKVALAFAASAMALAMPAQAQSEAPQVFERTGNWTADFGEDYCRLLRTFHSGDDEITLAFERIQPGPMMRMLIIGDSFRPYRGADRVGYRFEPREQVPPFEPSTDFATSRTPDGERLTILSFISLGEAPQFTQVFQQRTNGDDETTDAALPAPGEPPQFPAYDPQAEQARASEIRSLVFDEGLSRPIRFATGNMGDVMAVLQSCTMDLVSSWGVDAEKHLDLQRGAFPAPGPIISRTTVPFDQFARLTGNYNQVRVMVSAAGEPTSCHIHFPTLEEGVNDRICEQVMENAEFQPALDAQGDAIASYWLVPVFALLGPPPA